MDRRNHMKKHLLGVISPVELDSTRTTVSDAQANPLINRILERMT